MQCLVKGHHCPYFRLMNELDANSRHITDNCDHNFGTFDDFGVKNHQKVSLSHNMILMSKYKGQHS